MNKILFHAFCVMGCLSLLTACEKGDITNDIDTHSVKVLEAITSFDALGGTDSIYVEGNVTHAYANASWAKTQTKGNLVTVTTEPNRDLQSRHTTVVIKTSDVDSTVLAIDQLGPYTQLDMPGTIVMDDEAGSVSYKVVSTFGIKVSSNDSWITPKYEHGALTITTTKNDEGHLRRGEFTIESEAGKQKVKVVQVNFDKDLKGKYYLQIDETDKNNKQVTTLYNASLEKKGDAYVLKVGNSGVEVPVIYDADNVGLSIASGQAAGKFKQYYIGTVVGASESKLSLSPSNLISGEFNYSEEVTKKVADLDGTVLTFGKPAMLILGTFDSPQFSNDSYKAYYLMGTNVYLYRLKPTTASAKSFDQPTFKLK